MALVSLKGALLWRWYRGQQRYCGAGIAESSAIVALVSRPAALLWPWYREQQRYCGAGIADSSATVALVSRTATLLWRWYSGKQRFPLTLLPLTPLFAASPYLLLMTLN